jgi:hypothetical protein
MVLVNEPVPVPSVVLVDRDTVGLAVVLHTTPFAVTDAPPSDVTFPPLDAPVPVMEPAVVVDTVGSANVVNCNSVP